MKPTTKTMTPYEFDKTMVLSRQHISPADRYELKIMAMKQGDALAPLFVFASGDLGLIVHIPYAAEPMDELRDAIHTLQCTTSFSQALFDLLIHAKRLNCNFIRFDEDGPVIPGFQVW